MASGSPEGFVLIGFDPLEIDSRLTGTGIGVPRVAGSGVPSIPLYRARCEVELTSRTGPVGAALPRGVLFLG